MADDPIVLFNKWYDQARRARIPLYDAMALATADSRGRPSVRFVLLKQADARGFVFYTNSLSRKGRELDKTPHASLAFYWDKTGKQVRVEGRVVRVSPAEADAYWATRSRPSQLGAVASRQSAPLAGRIALIRKLAKLALRYAGNTVPRPAEWTGYRIVPHTIEFWTRRVHRLHDRVLFRLGRRGWTRQRLQP